MKKALKIGTEFVVAIKNTDLYSTDGCKNGDKGIIISYVADDYAPGFVPGEYWVSITREDGSVCEQFLIDESDILVAA